jgi:radical SAM protein with 4Fe4S-binding SPASM domain
MKDILINKNGPKTVDEFITAKGNLLNKETVLKNILKSKAPDYTEIEISFFQLCALHCRFCWQDNYDETGTTSIEEKSQIAIDYLKREASRLRSNIQVHMLGGELFEDSIDYYQQYFDFILPIKKHCDEFLPEKNLLFVFLTNMNFQLDSTKDKLDAFLKKLTAHGCKFILTTSWDPTGRPLKGEITTRFHQNITFFKEHLAEITFVLTKPTIKKLLQDKVEYLEFLYESGFNLDYDYYMPTTKVDELMPSDRELLNAFRMLINKFPKISKLQSWTTDTGNPGKLTCASLNKITILPDGTLTNCRHLNYDQSDFETKITNESNSEMILNYVSKKECLSCTYFEKCPLSCFVMSDHKTFLERQELSECYYKILFRETDELKASVK